MNASRENGHQPIESILNQAQLVASDFDGTMFDTFEPSPTGIGVNEAYRLAIEQVFDFDHSALERYLEEGEHRNRTPTEIVHSLAPSATPAGVKRLTEQVVQAKLDVLLDQVGQPLADGELWPRPMPGFKETWQYIYDAREPGRPIWTAVISAGHTEFIKKCLTAAELEMPDFMVTDETIRGLYTTMPLEKLTKPSVLPIEIIKAQWLGAFAETEAEREALRQAGIAERIVYLGDDPAKDGQLAHNANIPFIHIDKDNAEAGWLNLQTALRAGSLIIRQEVHEPRQQ